MAWTGPVEHLFFHTLLIHPARAFADPRQGRGFRDYFVTVGEFQAVLSQLYANGWSLVDIHRAVDGTTRVPLGRKPFVLSVDDVNYYDEERPSGSARRLVLSDGRVLAEEDDGRGGTRTTDNDIVPLVDEFVAEHPDFSADGARGVLAPTGYQGLLGERVQDTSAPDIAQRRQRVVDVADALKAEGWTFASHGYAHIDFAKSSLAEDRRDVERWKAEAEPLLGPTDVFIYPFGAAPPPTSATTSMLRDEGYSVLCDIDVRARATHVNGVTVMARRHVDGLALTQQRRALLPLFDVDLVVDRQARGLQ